MSTMNLLAVVSLAVCWGGVMPQLVPGLRLPARHKVASQ
jgi:hypothetical protein